MWAKCLVNCSEDLSGVMEDGKFVVSAPLDSIIIQAPDDGFPSG